MRRLAISSAPTSTVISCDSSSTVIVSPSWTRAIGPPSCASGHDVANNESVTAAREAAVGDEGDIFEEASASECAGWCQHLGHAGPALRPFVANHDHIARRDAAFFKASEHVFLAVEHAGRAGETEAFFAGDLAYRSAGGEVAPQNGDVTTSLDCTVELRHDVLILCEVRGAFKVLAERLGGDGELIAVEQTFIEQVAHHARHTTHGMQVFHHVLPRWLEVR